MLFDPKIKYNGKLKRVQFFDPNKITLKEFDKVKNNFKIGDSLIVTENDTITEAIAKLDESMHPNMNDFYIDFDAMEKLYPGKTNAIGEVINLEDGMKIIFNRPLNVYKYGEAFLSSGLISFGVSYNFLDYNESTSKTVTINTWDIITLNPRCLNFRQPTILYSKFMPNDIGNYEVSEFCFYYLILSPYVDNTNYITIYKTNLKSLKINHNVGRLIY